MLGEGEVAVVTHLGDTTTFFNYSNLELKHRLQGSGNVDPMRKGLNIQCSGPLVVTISRTADPSAVQTLNSSKLLPADQMPSRNFFERIICDPQQPRSP